ncbi:MAG: hypothetical protein NZ742_07620 [Acidobacteria bacterium]|nr:hypothetical protein [Acidobacteriota bacterium]MDW7984696.1 hypothetical protein [Acidobacteriota bacterium]
MDAHSVLSVLRPWFAYRGWHLGSVLPRASGEDPGVEPTVLGAGYDDHGRRTLFPIWVAPEVTPRLLEVVDHFQRRWPESGRRWPVPVEHVIPIVGALRWTLTQIEAVTTRGAQPLTPADVDVEALVAALRETR